MSLLVISCGGYHAVASELGISERTVRNHMYSVSEKLQTNTVVESVIKAIELGIINVRLQ